MLPRTDLALEMGEKYKNDNIEISGVLINEKYDKNKIKITKVEIVDEHGAMLMARPMGTYITIENYMNSLDSEYREYGNITDEESLAHIIEKNIRQLTKHIKDKRILIVGLGNKEITPDSLGPAVIQHIDTTRHLVKEDDRNIKNVAALSPGVTSQTGMEVKEIVSALIKEIDINLVIVIDALAARNIDRVLNTIQITDTGISPGAGVGNNRKKLNKEVLGVDVIAIGVPTVVDAITIVNDTIEEVMKQEGLTGEEIEIFNNNINSKTINHMYVTPNDIDKSIDILSRIIANSLNEF